MSLDDDIRGILKDVDKLKETQSRNDILDTADHWLEDIEYTDDWCNTNTLLSTMFKAENKDNILDISGNNNHSQYRTNTFVDGSKGKLGTCAQFDGKEDHYINTPHSSSLVMTTGLTIDTWLYIDAFLSLQLIITKEEDYGLRFASGSDSNKIEGFIKKSGTKIYSAKSNALSLNTWYHVVMTYNNTDIRLYINGVLQGTPTATTGSIYNSSKDLFIG